MCPSHRERTHEHVQFECYSKELLWTDHTLKVAYECARELATFGKLLMHVFMINYVLKAAHKSIYNNFMLIYLAWRKYFNNLILPFYLLYNQVNERTNEPRSTLSIYRTIMRTNDTQFRHPLESAARPSHPTLCRHPNPSSLAPFKSGKFSDEHPMSR